jgi:hypothetical protein
MFRPRFEAILRPFIVEQLIKFLHMDVSMLWDPKQLYGVTLWIINNQHYALICTTPLFYILAPTCFGSSLPSSGSFLDPSELLEIQIK